MLSNPPLNYGPDLGAASADPVETENYEALLNLGIIKKFIFIMSLLFQRRIFSLFVYSGTFGRSEASRIGSDADRSTAVVSIFRRDRRRWPEHLRHLHVRIRNAPDASRSSLQPRISRQMHWQMAQGTHSHTYCSLHFIAVSIRHGRILLHHVPAVYSHWPIDWVSYWSNTVANALPFCRLQSNRTCPICRGDASEFFHSLE